VTRSWTFGQQLVFGYALAGLTLLMVAVAGFTTTGALVGNQVLVAHTYQVRREFAELMARLADAETGVRGFVITGRDDFLEPYASGAGGTRAALVRLRQLTADNPEQQRRLLEMAPAIEQRLSGLSQRIATRRNGGFDAAAKETVSGEGKDVMDRIRQLAAAGDAAESRLLDQRTAETQASADIAKEVILWGGLAGVGAVALAGWLIILSLTRRIGTAVSQVQSSSAELQAAANQLREALGHAGYEAAVAVSGENGLRMAADIRPAAIIVDGEMPGLDGLSVIRRLRLDAGLRHTPCLLLTGADGQETELQALESGADAFVRKSDGGAVVLARLAAILRGAGVPAAAPSLMGPKKILAVDDDEIFLGRIMADLKREGYDVVPAQGGEEALELLEAEKVDCVLPDLAMPGLGGVETCRRLKANPATRRLPVILFSARGDGVAMLEALGAGADDVVPKSGDFELLRARLLAQIRRRQFADEKSCERE
jgi:DNA-binding response OmpR family regulator/CHASE3 domain sensor protein